MANTFIRYSHDISAARLEVQFHGGRIIHEFGSSAFVAEMPSNVETSALECSSNKSPDNLDTGVRLSVEAWNALPAEVALREPRKSDLQQGIKWDTPGFQTPRHPGNDPHLKIDVESEELELLSTGTQSSQYMTGTIAVGLVLVSRNSGTEVITPAEQQQIIQQAQQALNFLATVEPKARIAIRWDVRLVTVNSVPGPYSGVPSTANKPYEEYERDWRDAALATLGFGAGTAGFRAYARSLQEVRAAKWAFVIFATKYALNHFAYASGERLVIGPNDKGGGSNWGGWGINRINQVLAHESCHIFGAADEYGRCVCGGSHGVLGVKNNNCVNCFSGGGTQAICLMDQNDLALCDWTRGQIGWDPRLFYDPGIIYAVDHAGKLKFARDHARNGTGDIAISGTIGQGGWDQFKFLFSGGDGIIYAVDNAGKLKFARDHARNGTGDVAISGTIGQGGWDQFKFLFNGEV